MITSLLTDTKINIPIEAIPFISKQFSGNFYKSKGEIALEITKQIIKSFNIKRLLADAHFATKQMITDLTDKNVNFLMKIPRNRTVTIN